MAVIGAGPTGLSAGIAKHFAIPYNRKLWANSDHAFLAGQRAAEQARQSLIQTSREVPGERIGVLFGQAHEPG